MSEQEKHWYQNEWRVLFVVLLMGVFAIWLFVKWLFVKWYEHLEVQKPLAFPEVSGRLDQTLLGNPVLHVHVTHHVPGVLRNGMLTIRTDSDQVNENDRTKIHSFEEWPPNEEHQVVLKVRLIDFQPDQEIPLTIRLVAKSAKPFERSVAWLGDTWASNKND